MTLETYEYIKSWLVSINWVTLLISTLVLLAIAYAAWFFGANHEAIVHNMGNPCVITPLNFGACTP